MASEFSKHGVFGVPRAFEDFFGKGYTAPEKYFYVMLRKRLDELQPKDGWFFCADVAVVRDGRRDDGFASCGLSSRTCKSARKKLKADSLIETRYVHGRKGHRIGTEYRLLDDKLSRTPELVYRQVMSRLETRAPAQLGTTRQDSRVFRGIVARYKGLDKLND
jgi:hypothetical protein